MSDVSPQRKGRVFYGWIVLGACFAISLISGSLFYSRGVFLPAMSEDFGGSRFAISLAFTAAYAVGAVFAPFIGRALDIWPARRVLLTGTALVTVGYVLTALAPNIIIIFLIFGIFFGIGGVSISTFSTSKVVVMWFKRRRGLALSLDVAGASVAGILIPPIAAWLLLNYGWRGGYVILGTVLACVLVPVVTFFIKAPSETGDVPDGIRNEDADRQAMSPAAEVDLTWSTKELLASPPFWGIVLLFGGMMCVWQGVILHLYGHLMDSELGAYQASFILSVMGVLIVSGKPLLGWLADALGAKTSIAISLAGQIIGTFLFTLAQSQSAFLIAAAVYGFGLSGMAPLRNMALATAFGSRSYGSANGLMQPLALPIVLLASPIAGFIHDRLGSYDLAFQVFLVILLVTSPMLLLIRSARQEIAASRLSPKLD